MTEENKDIEQIEQIEQVEKKETVEKPKQQTTKDIIFGNLILFGFFFIIVVIFLNISRSSGCNLPTYSDSSVASSLLQSLQSAAAIYVAQERVAPKVFSDFVTPSGAAASPMTLSLENIEGEPDFISPKEIKMKFNEGDATYYLNGTDVTASYNFDQIKIKKEVDYQPIIAFWLISLLVSFIVFLLYKVLSTSLFGWIIMIILIMIGLGSISVPKFTKPAIYLYPTTPTNVNITLDKRIRHTLDVPTYAPNKGWNVLAYPDGKLFDLQPHYTNCNDLDPKTFGLEYAKKACLKNRYPYIYWEGNSFKHEAPPMYNGWLVETSKFKKFLNAKLDYVGFNKIEKKEFIRYWEHKVKETKQETVFVCFMQTALIDSYFPMTIKPQPDHINRFYIIVDLNVDNHISPMPQELTKFNREGFTLVDWGGALIKKRGLR